MVGVLGTGGCVHRKLTVISTPPGAMLLMNDRRLGQTPYSYDFQWYGWHRLTLLKQGYERVEERLLIRCPWYLWIPMDVAMELLPLPIRHTKVLTYTLVPATPLPEPVPPELSADKGDTL